MKQEALGRIVMWSPSRRGFVSARFCCGRFVFTRKNIHDFASTLTAADIQFGYAAITWGGNDLQAIKEISEVAIVAYSCVEHLKGMPTKAQRIGRAVGKQ